MRNKRPKALAGCFLERVSVENDKIQAGCSQINTLVLAIEVVTEQCTG